MEFVTFARSKVDGLLPLIPKESTGVYHGIATRGQIHDIINDSISELPKEERDMIRPIFKGVVNDAVRSAMHLGNAFTYHNIFLAMTKELGSDKGTLVAQKTRTLLANYGVLTNPNLQAAPKSACNSSTSKNGNGFKKGAMVGLPIGALLGAGSMIAYQAYMNKKNQKPQEVNASAVATGAQLPAQAFLANSEKVSEPVVVTASEKPSILVSEKPVVAPVQEKREGLNKPVVGVVAVATAAGLGWGLGFDFGNIFKK
jgi:hypothetical protein